MTGQFDGWTEVASSSFAFSRGPFGLDFDPSLAARRVMEEAAPWPILGAAAQSRVDRVGMNAVEPLDKVRLIANVEVVVALLPKVILVSGETLCHSLLQRFQGIR